MPLQTTRPSDPADASDADGDDASIDPLPDDDIFHILQTNRRRDAIRYLLEHDEPVRMRDVAEYVAARENETTVAKLSSTERQRVYIPLYQSHLPKLDKEGIIEYNKSRGIVEPTDRLELFRPYLELQPNQDVSSAAEDGPVTVLRQRETVLALASTGLLLSATIGVYAAVSAVETSLALAVGIGSIAIPGMLLGVLTTALFALSVGRTDGAAAAPGEPTEARPLN